MTEENIKKLGDELKAARLEKGFTQKELANMSGVTIQTVLHYEKGTPSMTLNTLNRITHALGLNVVTVIYEPSEVD